MPPPDPALPATADLSRSVAADMEAIFAEAPVQAAAVDERPVQVLRRSVSGQGRLRPAAIGLVAAVGLAGLGAGTLIPRAPAAPQRSPAPAAAAAQQVHIAVAPVITPEPAPAAVTEAANGAGTRADAAAETPRLLPAAARPAHAHAVRPRPAVASRHRPADPGGSSVFAADLRLREAYDRAMRAGVARTVLADYRERWADLRERDADNPERLAVAYRDLSEDLGRMAARPRASRAEPMDEPRLRSPFPWR